MTVTELSQERNIAEVLHFTTNRGLVGILASSGIKATKSLTDDEYLANILHKNAITRPEEAEDFDKSEDWLDYVNLSISAVNKSYMGFSRNWPHNRDVWWCVLSFDPVIMSHRGVYFATTNNGYEHCKRAGGREGLERLFDGVIPRKGQWRAYRGNRAPHLPTCQQAEVLYPRFLSLEHLRRIYVQTEEDSDRARGFLRDFGVAGVEVSISQEVFQGFPN